MGIVSSYISTRYEAKVGLTRERLSAGTNTLQVLAAGHAFITN
jgi:hypothetical protein